MLTRSGWLAAIACACASPQLNDTSAANGPTSASEPVVGAASSPAPTTVAPTPTASAAAPSVAAPKPGSHFPPADVAPPFARSAEAGDGKWQTFGDALGADAKPLLYTTVLHPHEASRFISVTVVAIDLARTRLDFLPGVDDVGKQTVPFVPGLVPEPERSALVAVFNGGFMPRHGRWGIRIGDTELLPPRDQGCTIGLLANGEVRISSWPALAPVAAELRALRQTPPCLVEDGAVNANLLAGRDKAWAGQTPGVITRRRSAIGLSQDGRTLFYAIGVETTPKHLATGLLAAGARNAAQLDINWNWTRFLLFGKPENGAPIVTTTLAPVEHTKRDYVAVPSKRDFFFLLRRE